MNPEKELLVEKCHSNLVLKIICSHIASKSSNAAFVLLPPDDCQGSTGLSRLRITTAVNWLLRKGLLVSTGGMQYHVRKAKYKLDDELWESASLMDASAIGSEGWGILEAYKRRKKNVLRQEWVLQTCNDGNIRSGYGGINELLSMNDAIELQCLLANYVEFTKSWGEKRFESHRHCELVLERFGTYSPQYQGNQLSDYLPKIVCDCNDCKVGYQMAFSTLTNHRDHNRREQKMVRDALKELT